MNERFFFVEPADIKHQWKNIYKKRIIVTAALDRPPSRTEALPIIFYLSQRPTSASPPGEPLTVNDLQEGVGGHLVPIKNPGIAL
jgi:hypothetical protein